MRFLVDAQLPQALVRMIQAAGHDCEHVADAGLLTAKDGQIHEYALRLSAVIVTKDEDFRNRKAKKRGAPPVLWLRVGNCSNRALLNWFEPLFPQLVDRLKQGEDLIEVI